MRRLTREQVELAVLDVLEQAGAARAIDSSTPVAALRLTEVEFDDLAADLRGEFDVALASDELHRAQAIGDIVDLVLARTVSSSSSS